MPLNQFIKLINLQQSRTFRYNQDDIPRPERFSVADAQTRPQELRLGAEAQVPDPEVVVLWSGAEARIPDSRRWSHIWFTMAVLRSQPVISEVDGFNDAQTWRCDPRTCLL
ncbi:unnamed protein product [Phytophthora lilii]|uniref:Unnamed protein product n=1 Tax=Phytophthora lilii TaxID=2077276 RepID=A0A9W6U4B6_9STRA|nr:unnamed protein product [Phytophthora lilii]